MREHGRWKENQLPEQPGTRDVWRKVTDQREPHGKKGRQGKTRQGTTVQEGRSTKVSCRGQCQGVDTGHDQERPGLRPGESKASKHQGKTGEGDRSPGRSCARFLNWKLTTDDQPGSKTGSAGERERQSDGGQDRQSVRIARQQKGQGNDEGKDSKTKEGEQGMGLSCAEV